MDAWYEEDERVLVHVRDPYHRVDVLGTSRHVVVRHGTLVIAESVRPKALYKSRCRCAGTCLGQMSGCRFSN